MCVWGGEVQSIDLCSVVREPFSPKKRSRAKKINIELIVHIKSLHPFQDPLKHPGLKRLERHGPLSVCYGALSIMAGM